MIWHILVCSVEATGCRGDPKKLSHRYLPELRVWTCGGPLVTNLRREPVPFALNSEHFGIRPKAFRNMKKTISHPTPYEYEGMFGLWHGLQKYEKTLSFLNFYSET